MTDVANRRARHTLGNHATACRRVVHNRHHAVESRSTMDNFNLPKRFHPSGDSSRMLCMLS